MANRDTFSDILYSITAKTTEDMSERDVENLFLESNYYTELGYEGTGTDIRSEQTLPDNRRPDYITLDDNQRVVSVYEFKTTGRDLGPHTDQLFGYMDDLKAEYGVLTNGEQLRLYRREDNTPLLTISLAEITTDDAATLQSALRKPTWNITDPESVNDFLADLEPMALDSDLGQAHFYETFRLEDDSPFVNLVTALMGLLRELRDENQAKFVTGAYEFWDASYANVPDNVPDSWDPFINGEQSLKDFMFCVESGHALLARLLLAKACDDYDFFPNHGIQRYFTELQGFGQTIDLDAYPVAANGLIEEMRNQLVESLFEDDIFIWWTDAYQEETASLHSNPYNRFRDVAQEGSGITRVSEATRERFSRAVAHVLFSVVKFNFSAIEGDPLGDLYQHYFDPETRKALGEFYTPQEVIEYIMDGVEYEVGVSNERLIDPSCGSGTFLIEAVERYLEDVRRFNEDPDWEQHLMELCSRPHIVGLDIHPFAVLMAQIRFMVAILPEYRQAKQNNPDFTLRRLPIFRTDTLRNERESTGHGTGDDGGRQMTLDALTENNQDVLIPVPLPVEAPDEDSAETEDDFLVQRVRMPLFDTIQTTGVSNFGEYFSALQGVLDVVKYHMSKEMWEYRGGLQQGIGRYTTREYDGVEEFFKPYVNDMLETVQYLREEHGDGRLFKMFEDSVLALVVKNYMDYEYVVGNPPYVSIKGISSEKQNSYKKLYDSAFGRFDLYVLFLERGLDWLSEDGKLGYITPNKFTRSNYGREIRRIISSEYSLTTYVEFGDVEVFDDATNFACIMIIDQMVDCHEVPYAKVHKGTKGSLGKIRQLLGETEMVTEELELSTFPTQKLTHESWRFTPQTVRNVADTLDSRARKKVGDVALGVRQGISSGGDDAFVVSNEDIDKYGLEDKLLLPIIRGKNVRRWKVKWQDEYAIYPYDSKGDLVDLNQYPNTKSYLDEQEEYLRDRYCVKKGGKGIYEYDGPRPKSVFEGDFKIPTPDMSTTNNFAHADRYRCFKNTVYVLTFSESQPYSEEVMIGLLNSSVAEFIIKQISPPLRGSPFRYRYKTQYVNEIPLPECDYAIEELVEAAVQYEVTKRRIERFPHNYIDSVDGELEYIDYEWQTARKPVNAGVTETAAGIFTVEAGRTDSITTPQLTSEQRAQYVHAAVDGRNVKKGEKMSLPIPRRDKDVQALLDGLEQDREEVAATDISELESEIDEIVYDLFDLTEDERQVIEDYLDVF